MTRYGSIPAEEIGGMHGAACHLSDGFNEGQEHWGYWYGDADTTPVADAGRRITRRVIDTAGLREGQRVLDAGCGVGAPAIDIARATGARVTGITVSENEVLHAKQRLAESGLDDRVEFLHGDYRRVPAADGTFDAVVSMEALPYSPDLAATLAEFRRVLRPGGIVALSLCTREDMDDERHATTMDAFRINCLLSTTEWVAELERAGFVVEEYTQCGPRVYGQAMRYHGRALELRESWEAEFGEEGFQALLEGYSAHQDAGFGYALIAARAPQAASG